MDANRKNGNGGVELKTNSTPQYDEDFEEFQEASNTFDADFSQSNQNKETSIKLNSNVLSINLMY